MSIRSWNTSFFSLEASLQLKFKKYWPINMGREDKQKASGSGLKCCSLALKGDGGFEWKQNKDLQLCGIFYFKETRLVFFRTWVWVFFIAIFLTAMDSLKNPILPVHLQFSVYMPPTFTIICLFYFHNLGFLLPCPPLRSLKCKYVHDVRYWYTNKKRD